MQEKSVRPATSTFYCDLFYDYYEQEYRPFTYIPGMTWEQWCASEYVSGTEFFINNNTVWVSGGTTYITTEPDSSIPVKPSDLIESKIYGTEVD